MKKIKVSKTFGSLPKQLKSSSVESRKIAGQNNNAFVFEFVFHELKDNDEVQEVFNDQISFVSLLRKATDLAMNNYDFANLQFDLYSFSKLLESEFRDLSPAEKFIFIRIIFPEITKKLLMLSAISLLENQTLKSIVDVIASFPVELDSLSRLILERAKKPFLINEAEQNAFLIALSVQSTTMCLDESQKQVVDAFVRIAFCTNLEDFICH